MNDAGHNFNFPDRIGFPAETAGFFMPFEAIDNSSDRIII
jgi:hypothetical protein